MFSNHFRAKIVEQDIVPVPEVQQSSASVEQKLEPKLEAMDAGLGAENASHDLLRIVDDPDLE